MGREVKTISLDSTTAEIAKNIPNFSEWVRTQLLMQHILDGGEPIHIELIASNRNYQVNIPTHRDAFGRPVLEKYNTKRCNPYKKKGKCTVCWPPHLSIAEHTLEIAKLVQQGRLDPFAEGAEEE